MGSDSGESDEHSVRTVTLSAFYIDQNEVTNAQYRQCVEADVCEPPECSERYKDTTKEDHPVVCVSWLQAETYCGVEWRGGRLPTEAEWEKAARGTDGRIYPWGDEPPPNRALLNFNSNIGDTTPVSRYPDGASPYGVYDMAGNVSEWVADWYDAEYYSIAPDQDPQGPVSGTSKVLRGGSWRGGVGSALIRQDLPPVLPDNYIGFRCAADLP
jgi:formylglycine-generating enzyme required for sulfatase activity